MSIKIKSLSKVTADLKKFGVEGTNVIKRELDISATNIQSEAFNAAPAYLGKEPLNIKQRIKFKAENGGLTYKIGIFGTDDLDFYIEAGTGLSFLQLVQSNPKYNTPEFLTLARTFFKTGDGTLTPRPYLFPAFFNESPRLIEKLKSELTKLAKKV
jgi:hypothetical protein